MDFWTLKNVQRARLALGFFHKKKKSPLTCSTPMISNTNWRCHSQTVVGRWEVAQPFLSSSQPATGLCLFSRSSSRKVVVCSARWRWGPWPLWPWRRESSTCSQVYIDLQNLGWVTLRDVIRNLERSLASPLWRIHSSTPRHTEPRTLQSPNHSHNTTRTL